LVLIEKVNLVDVFLLNILINFVENHQKMQAELKKSVLSREKILMLSSVASVGVALILVIIKAFAAKISGSNAVLASLADSGLDLIASLITLFSVRYAQAPPDEDHRYGHGKAEALAGMFQAGLVAVSCVLIGISSIERFFNPVELRPEGGAISVMVISIVLTSILISFQTWSLKQTGSIATKGDRAHYLSDLLSNAVALIGIFVAIKFKILIADAIAGLFITIWLLIGAWHIATEAIDHLLDKEAPEEVREKISQIVLSIDKVRGVHDLRTRMSGKWLHVQLHLELPPNLTLSEAHPIVVEAEARIREQFPDTDTIIHADPDEDGEPHGHPQFGLH
jgi:cation diffusion facilitator family transporter